MAEAGMAIAGAAEAGTGVAHALREPGWQGTITLIGADMHPHVSARL